MQFSCCMQKSWVEPGDEAMQEWYPHDFCFAYLVINHGGSHLCIRWQRRSSLSLPPDLRRGVATIKCTGQLYFTPFSGISHWFWWSDEDWGYCVGVDVCRSEMEGGEEEEEERERERRKIATNTTQSMAYKNLQLLQHDTFAILCHLIVC